MAKDSDFSQASGPAGAAAARQPSSPTHKAQAAPTPPTLNERHQQASRIFVSIEKQRQQLERSVAENQATDQKAAELRCTDRQNFLHGHIAAAQQITHGVLEVLNGVGRSDDWKANVPPDRIAGDPDSAILAALDRARSQRAALEASVVQLQRRNLQGLRRKRMLIRLSIVMALLAIIVAPFANSGLQHWIVSSFQEMSTQSSQNQGFAGPFFSVSYPAGWMQTPVPSSSNIIFGPAGSVTNSGSSINLNLGVEIGLVENPGSNPAQAIQRMQKWLLQHAPRAKVESLHPRTIACCQAYEVNYRVLANNSYDRCRLLVIPRGSGGYLFALFVAPESQFKTWQPRFDSIANSIRPNASSTPSETILDRKPVETASTAPSIMSVSTILPGATQRIIINGRGFGDQAPYSGNSPYIMISDLTGHWDAGNSGASDWVTLNVSQWNDNQIVIQGFTGSYGRGWSLQPGHRVRIQIWNAQTGAGPATTTGIVGTPASEPVITSVSTILPGATQRIIINGRGFGDQAPYNGNSPYIMISDLTGHWDAGNSGASDWVTLNVSQWNDNQIVIQGFTGSYGGGWSLQPGHRVRIQIWNAQTGAGPANLIAEVAAK